MLDLIKDLGSLMRHRQGCRAAPTLMLLVVVDGFLIISQGSVAAPFINTLF
jgi:hypothetical protein